MVLETFVFNHISGFATIRECRIRLSQLEVDRCRGRGRGTVSVVRIGLIG